MWLICPPTIAPMMVSFFVPPFAKWNKYPIGSLYSQINIASLCSINVYHFIPTIDNCKYENNPILSIIVR
jgi:hypothetical protein